jgi:hypothetical protein
LRINGCGGAAAITLSNDKREEPAMKIALGVIAHIAAVCVWFIDASRQRRILRTMQELGHPGVLADINAA